MSSQEEKHESGEKHESEAQMDLGENKAGRGFNFDDYVENPQMERRITRKCDFHILPWIFALWLLAFIDRSNIGESDCRILGHNAADGAFVCSARSAPRENVSRRMSQPSV